MPDRAGVVVAVQAVVPPTVTWGVCDPPFGPQLLPTHLRNAFLHKAFSHALGGIGMGTGTGMGKGAGKGRSLDKTF